MEDGWCAEPGQRGFVNVVRSGVGTDTADVDLVWEKSPVLEDDCVYNRGRPGCRGMGLGEVIGVHEVAHMVVHCDGWMREMREHF